MQLFAIDGALFRTPDTPPLREHFGSGNTNYEHQTPFTMLRLVALMNIRSHVIADVAITLYRKGEIRIAEAFIEGIIADSEYVFFEFAVLGQLETIAPRFGAILLDLEVKALTVVEFVRLLARFRGAALRIGQHDKHSDSIPYPLFWAGLCTTIPANVPAPNLERNGSSWLRKAPNHLYFLLFIDHAGSP